MNSTYQSAKFFGKAKQARDRFERPLNLISLLQRAPAVMVIVTISPIWTPMDISDPLGTAAKGPYVMTIWQWNSKESAIEIF